MGIVGNLNDYTRYQAAEAMQTAAANPSGAASAGVGMGIGFGMASEMAKAYADAGKNQASPPPLPTGTQYYIASNGEKSGPFEHAVIKQKIADGEITRETLVWHDPMSEWAAAEKIDALLALFPKMPPPLPGE